MSKFIEVDVSDYQRFFERLGKAANGDFKNEITGFLEGVGVEFLRVLQDEIVRREVMDSRFLLQSFEKGSEDGVWTLNEGDLTLEVGTNIKYAKFVNDGHNTNPPGVKARFVPGYWDGDRFIYVPGADTGMMLTQKWVPGAHYWEAGLKIIKTIYPELLDRKLQEWIDNYFSDFL